MKRSNGDERGELAVVTGPPVRTLIVDDEPLARRTLRSMIEEIPWLECVGEAADGDRAVSLIQSLDPELIFLDVRLPGMSGIEALERARSHAAVIFATAFDGYARAAFELGAIDYVTKPFGPERLHRAVGRAAMQVRAMREESNGSTPGQPGLSSLRARLDAVRSQPVTTIFARDRGLIIPIPVHEIVRCEADGDFVAVHTRERNYLVYLNLGDLASQLDSRLFVRVHRSHLVNMTAVDAIESLDANRVELRLRDGTRIAASRTGTRALRARMRQSNQG
jgi:two-component system LytT family response regulator